MTFAAGNAVLEPATMSTGASVLAKRYPGLRTLFFVIGTQKASTTWLAKMLARAQGCHVAPAKELHYWSMLESGKPQSEIVDKRNRQIRKTLTAMVRSTTNPARIRAAYGLLRIQMTERRLAVDPSIESYIRALMRGWKGQAVAGELTPRYCLLPAEAIGSMAAMHPDTRFVFVMRDPVERMWSGVKHIHQTDTRESGMVRRDILEAFEHAVRDPSSNAHRLSAYAELIPEIERGVPADRIAYFFHETIRTETEMARLSAFLGLDDVPADAGDRVNRSMHDALPMPADAARAARQALEPTYAFVAERFGARVPPSWRSGVTN